MRLTHLKVSGYRNIDRLEIDLSGERGVFIGANAQGKSNLLEAVYMLATMRAVRAETDAQVIARNLQNEVLPAARVVGQAETSEGPLKVEVTVTGRPGASGLIGTKTAKINGVAKRHFDAVGRLTAVLFTADDLDLISGTPSGRRRYLDVLLAQVEPAYSSARSKYERVVTQRNHLLKRIREGMAQRDELPYWDGELTKSGAVIFHRRARALSSIAVLAQAAHTRLAPGESLSLMYRPRLEPGRLDLESASEPEIAEAFAQELVAALNRDVAAGMTLQGPHRDDIEFTLDGFAASGFASRAQQRTIALALRLAESQYLREARDDSPILLLDDILSEMDAERRDSVLAALGNVDQMLVTGTDWDRFPQSFLTEASLFVVEAGSVRPLDSVPAGGGPQTGAS